MFCNIDEEQKDIVDQFIDGLSSSQRMPKGNPRSLEEA